MLMGSALLFSLSDSQIERPQTRYRQTTTRVHFRFKYMKFDQNIAKGTSDPRVEFISQDHSSQFTNLEHMYYNFRISNKR